MKKHRVVIDEKLILRAKKMSTIINALIVTYAPTQFRRVISHENGKKKHGNVQSE